MSKKAPFFLTMMSPNDDFCFFTCAFQRPRVPFSGNWIQRTIEKGRWVGDDGFVYLDSVVHKWDFIRIWLRVSQANNSAPTSACACVGSDRRGCDNSLCFCFVLCCFFFLSLSLLFKAEKRQFGWAENSEGWRCFYQPRLQLPSSVAILVPCNSFKSLWKEKDCKEY